MSRAKTFDEVLEANRQARRAVVKKAELPDLSHIDFDAMANSIIREAARGAGLQKARSAVDEVETRIAARIDKNPVTVTRAVAMQDVFSADPALYERYRRENTIGRDGQAMSADPAVRDVGVGRVTAKSADAELSERVQLLVSKTRGATVEQALAFVGRDDPELMARWQRESYA